MFARSLCSVIVIGFTLFLVSCIGFPGGGTGRPLSYNIRSVSVMANADVPLDLLRGVDRRVGSAIASTRPPQGAQRVVLLVRIDRLGKGNNARRRLDRAHFTVTATSVETGEPVAEGRLVANAPTDDPRFATEALAEEIAARIRFSFSLTTPRVRSLPPPRRLSTRLITDPVTYGPAPFGQAASAGLLGANVPSTRFPAAAAQAEPAVPPPRKTAQAKPATSVVDGASGTIRLDRGCDTSTVPDCLSEKP